MKKLIAVLISTLLIAGLCLPMAVSAAGVAPITVSVSAPSFEKGPVVLQVTVQNTSDSAITIEKIGITSGNFKTGTYSINETVPATDVSGDSTSSTTSGASQSKAFENGSKTFNIPTTYYGGGTNIVLEVYVSGFNPYKTNLAVTGANSGDAVTPVDPVDPMPYLKKTPTTTVRSGGSTAFPIMLGTQSGDLDSLNVSVAAEGEGSAGKFTIAGGASEWQYATDADSYWGDIIITPTLRVANNVADGEYNLIFTLRYTYGGGKAGTATIPCPVVVHGRAGESAYLTSAVFQTKQIGTGNKSKITVTIQNPMSASLWNVNVSFDAANSQGFSLYESFQPVVLDSISAKSSGTAVFSMYVDSTVKTGNYPLSFNLSYESATGEAYASRETVYAQVTRTEDAGGDTASGKPRLIVSKYATDVEQIQAGKEFTLDFTLQNTSTSAAVSNIKVTVGSDTAASTGGQTGTGGSAANGVFYPTAGSNSFFIEKIGAKQSASNSIKLMTSQDIEPGVYSVILEIEYDSGAQTGLSSKEQISFSVAQVQRLELQGFTPPTDGMEGSSIPLNFQYINKGKSTIYNFTVCVEGDFILAEGDQYIGNLSAGYSDYFEGMLIPQKGASSLTGDGSGDGTGGAGDAPAPDAAPTADGTTAVNPLARTEGVDMMIGGDDSSVSKEDGSGDMSEGGELGMSSGGPYTCALVLKYEDSQGSQKELRKEFTVNIQPMDMGGGDGGNGMNGLILDEATGNLIDPVSGQMYDPMTMEPIQPGLPIWAIVLIAVGGVVVVGGGVFAFLLIRRKRMAAKKEIDEDEED